MWDAASTWNRLSARARLVALVLVVVVFLTPALAAGGSTAVAPPAPAGLTVSGGSTSTISVSWSPSTGATAYLVVRDGRWVAITRSTSYTVTGLQCGRAYSLGVISLAPGAYSRESKTTGSTSVCAGTPAGGGTPPPPTQNDTQAPTKPGPLTKTSATTGSVSVSWTASSDNVAVKEYALYLNGSYLLAKNGTSHTFQGLACGTSSTFGVEAVDTVGNRSTRSELTTSTATCVGSSPPPPPAADTQAPTKPAGLTKSSATDTSVSVTWTASTDNVGIKEYGLYVNGALAGTKTSLSHTFTGLNCGTTPVLGVDAVDLAGNRSVRTDLPASTSACPAPAPPPTPPPAPPASCSKVASPGAGTAQALLDSLSSGQVGCLHGGTYTASGQYVLDFSKANASIVSYPGERAVVKGIVQVRSQASSIRLARLTLEGTGEMNSVKVYAADFVLEDSDLTNAWRGPSCLMLGSESAGNAIRPIIRRNKFHECGNPANAKFDHAIYAGSVVDGLITENVFWNTTGYTIQLYPHAHRTVFSHNVVDGGSPSVRGGVVFGAEGSNPSSDNIVEFNVLTYAATYNITTSWGGTPGTGNIARSNCVFGGGNGNIASPNGFSSVGNITADPLFVNRAARDYRLAAGSPCLAVVGYDTAAKLG